jgi:hypothetical protein
LTFNPHGFSICWLSHVLKITRELFAAFVTMQKCTKLFLKIKIKIKSKKFNIIQNFHMRNILQFSHFIVKAISLCKFGIKREIHFFQLMCKVKFNFQHLIKHTRQLCTFFDSFQTISLHFVKIIRDKIAI